ncbi:MAG: PAS domain S-box protein [Elusimicrobia bacterium]|nr:PAS domain S-box protein [Elusimicrobiota bacterium]
MSAVPAPGSGRLLPPNPFDQLCIEVLKAVGKTLNQMGLYKPGHASIAPILADAHGILERALEQAAGLTYAFDQEFLLANGRVIGSASQVPGAVTAFFERYRVGCLTFKHGVSVEELAALCELAAIRPEERPDPGAFLTERKVSHIRVDEAVYVKAGEGGTGVGAEAKSGAVESAEGHAEHPFVRRIQNATIEDSLHELVKALIPDPVDQQRIIEAVIAKMRDDLDKRVKEATEKLLHDKTTLENEQARTQTVLNNMADGVVVVDDQGKILMMNPAAEDIYGATLAQVAGKSLAEAVRDPHLLAIAHDMGPVPGTETYEPGVKVVSAEESRRTLRASAAVVQNEAGKTVGMVSILPDVTKHNELARMEREFVAHVTHELRAPLSAIRAALEIMQGQFKGRLTVDDERMMGTALRNADRLNDLIRDILDFGKIEAGQMTVHPEKAEPAKIAEEAVESLKAWAERKTIALSMDVPLELPLVSADPRRAAQVLINLLSNLGHGHRPRHPPGGAREDLREIRPDPVWRAAHRRHRARLGRGQGPGPHAEGEALGP